MKYTTALLTAGMLLSTPAPQQLSPDSRRLDLHQTLTKTEETKPLKDSATYYMFPLSQELLNQIVDVSLDTNLETVIQRAKIDFRDTPLYMKGTRRHIGELLGYNQYRTIMQKYNGKDSLYDGKLADIDSVAFPLIYDELNTMIPHTLTELFADSSYLEYAKQLSDTSDLIVITKQANNKTTLAYYVGGRLLLASYASVGLHHATPTGLFHIGTKIPDKRSIKYKRAPMPYALHLSGAIFMHQGYVTGHPASHGCIRVPGLYQEILYYHAKAGTHVLIKDIY